MDFPVAQTVKNLSTNEGLIPGLGRSSGEGSGNSFQYAVLSCFSHVHLFETLWTVAHQAPLSIGFYRQEYSSGLPFPPLGDLPNPGI